MSVKIFKDKSHDDVTESLVSFMPGGRPFLAARLTGTKLRALLAGLAVEALRAESLMNEITCEHDIRTTTLLIEEWERALGIPDCCFGTDETIEIRRLQVLTKLANMSVQTEQDLIDLAALFGFVVEIIPGADRGLFPFVAGFPIYFFDQPASARFTMFVNVITVDFPNAFTYTFPITFAPSVLRVLECLFNKLSPANVEIIFQYELPDESGIITEAESRYVGTESGGIILLESA